MCGKGVVHATFIVGHWNGSYGCGVHFKMDENGQLVLDLRTHEPGPVAALRSPLEHLTIECSYCR
jgi:hypothetical protein